MKRWHIVSLILGALAVLWTLFPPPAAWVERVYSQGLYPLIAAVLIPITGAAPLPLAGILLILLPLLLIFLLARSWRRREGKKRHWFGRWLLRLASVMALGYALFLFLWGANYQREPVEAQLELTSEVLDEPIRAPELRTLAESLLDVVLENAGAERDGARAEASLRRAVQDVVAALNQGRTPTLPAGSKRLPAGLLLTFGNASGMVSPLTLEAFVDGGLPEYRYLATSAHELAHLAGYAVEADTDLISAIAGLRADDAYARYAMGLRFFRQVSRQLPSNARRTLYARLPDEALRDIAETLSAFEQFTPPPIVATVQVAVYDTYLRTQGMEEGIEDYGRVVNLLIYAQRGGKLFP